MPAFAEPAPHPQVAEVSTSDFQDMESLLLCAMDHLSVAAENPPGAPLGLTTGFPELDRLTRGLPPRKLIVLAGQPMVGKTAFALQLAAHVAAQEHQWVAWFSLGTGANHLAMRLMGLIAGIDPTRLADGRLLPEEWTRLEQAMPKLQQLCLQVDTTPGLSVDALNTHIRQVFFGRLPPPTLVVVDDLHSLCPRTSDDADAAVQVATTITALQALARECLGPVLLLTELPAGPLGKDLGTLMATLPASATLSRRADMILFLCPRDAPGAQPRHPALIDLVIARQYLGRTGRIPLRLDPSALRFDSVEAAPDA